MRSEAAFAKKECPIVGNTSARLLMAKGGFHCSMHTVLAVLHWQIQAAIPFTLVLSQLYLKTMKYFQAVLINLLKHNLQCTFTKESISLNKSWTFHAAKSSGKHRTSPWSCLFGSMGVLLEFPRRGKRFLYRVIQWRQVDVYKKNTITVGEATSCWDSLGATGWYRRALCSLNAKNCCSWWSPAPAKAFGECRQFQKKPGPSIFNERPAEKSSAGDKADAVTANVKLPCQKLWNEVERSSADPGPIEQLCFSLAPSSLPGPQSRHRTIQGRTRRQGWHRGHSVLTSVPTWHHSFRRAASQHKFCICSVQNL